MMDERELINVNDKVALALGREILARISAEAQRDQALELLKLAQAKLADADATAS